MSIERRQENFLSKEENIIGLHMTLLRGEL